MTPPPRSSGSPGRPGNSRVVYLANQDTDDVIELCSVPIDGGMPVKLRGSGNF